MAIPAGQKPKLDWREVYGGLSGVQKLVHRKGRWSAREADKLARDIYKWTKPAAEEMLRHELAEWGCDNDPSVGKSLAAFLRESAKRSGASIVNTYNYRLAHAIARVGQDTPTANRHVYLYRLFTGPAAWARAEYGADKVAEVAVTEVYGTIGLVKDLFYSRNRSLLEKMQGVEIQPYQASCPVCKAAVAGNPYPNWNTAPRMPAHVACPHFRQMVKLPGAQVKCAELWAGK